MNATTSAHVQVTRTGSYIDRIIPPRCRNPRDVLLETSTIIDIPVVDATEAPVAFTFAGQGPEHHSEIRVFDEKLYRPLTYQVTGRDPEAIAFDSEYFPEYAEHSHYHGQCHVYGPERGLDAHLEMLEQRFGDLLVIDGYVWRRTSEPRYVVMTFGMGGNHGGTSLSSTSQDNSNLSASSYYRADEFVAAQKHAIEVAQQRGDTESVGCIAKAEPLIRVHVDEAVRLVVPVSESKEVRDLRRELTNAVNEYGAKLNNPESAGHEADLFDRVVRLRRGLRSLTSDVAGAGQEVRPYEDR